MARVQKSDACLAAWADTVTLHYHLARAELKGTVMGNLPGGAKFSDAELAEVFAVIERFTASAKARGAAGPAEEPDESNPKQKKTMIHDL